MQERHYFFVADDIKFLPVMEQMARKELSLSPSDPVTLVHYQRFFQIARREQALLEEFWEVHVAFCGGDQGQGRQERMVLMPRFVEMCENAVYNLLEMAEPDQAGQAELNALKELERRGFKSRERNLKALRGCGGDVKKAVRYLSGHPRN
jgi:hypothetical protein